MQTNNLILRRKHQNITGTKLLPIALLISVIPLMFTCLGGSRPVFVFGVTPIIITSGSMSPEYRINSIVIIKKVPFDSIVSGDVILYESDALGGQLALHRVTRITENGVFTKGDANRHEDSQCITKDTFIGKSILKSNIIYFLTVNKILILKIALLLSTVLFINDYKKLFRKERKTIEK